MLIEVTISNQTPSNDVVFTDEKNKHRILTLLHDGVIGTSQLFDRHKLAWCRRTRLARKKTDNAKVA